MFDYISILEKEKKKEFGINELLYLKQERRNDLFFYFADELKANSDSQLLLSITINKIIEFRRDRNIDFTYIFFSQIIIRRELIEQYFNINKLLIKMIEVLYENKSINYRDLYKIFDLLYNKETQYSDVMNFIINKFFKTSTLPIGIQRKYLKTRGNLFRYTVEYLNYDIKKYSQNIKSLKREYKKYMIEPSIEALVMAKRNKSEQLPSINYSIFRNAVITKHFKFFMREDSDNFNAFLTQKLHTDKHRKSIMNIMHRPITDDLLKGIQGGSFYSGTVFVIPCGYDFNCVGKKYSFYDIALGAALSYAYKDGNIQDINTIILYSDDNIETINMYKYKLNMKAGIEYIIDALITRKSSGKISLPRIIDKLIESNIDIKNLYIFSKENPEYSCKFGLMNQKSNNLLCLERYNTKFKIAPSKLNVFINHPLSPTKDYNNFNIYIIFNDVYKILGYSYNIVKRFAEGRGKYVAKKSRLYSYKNFLISNRFKDALL